MSRQGEIVVQTSQPKFSEKFGADTCRCGATFGYVRQVAAVFNGDLVTQYYELECIECHTVRRLNVAQPKEAPAGKKPVSKLGE